MRAFCCQFGLGIEGLARIGSVVHGMRAFCCQFGLGIEGLRELAALCTVCVHSAANSGD